jgi:hypothetical protein
MGATSCIHIEDSQGNGPMASFDVNNKRDILVHYDDGTEKFALMSDGFIRTTSGWKYRQLAIGIGDVAANNDAFTYPLFRAKHDVTITNVSIATDATATANASHYQTCYVEQTGNTTDLGTLTTASVAFTAKVPRAVSIATTGDPDHLKAGQTLQLRIVKTGNGVAMYGVTVHVTYTIDQPNTTVGTATDNVMRIINEVGTASAITFDHDQRDALSVRENGIEKFRIDVNGKMHGGNTGDIPVDQYYYQAVNVGTISTADSKKCPIYKPHCTTRIRAIYIGVNTTALADSNSAFWQLLFKDNSGNVISDAFVHGPYGGAIDLTKGQLYDVGEVAPEFATIAAAGHIQLEFVQTGTASDMAGLTIVICYTKEA